jgi:hypothetical protein
LSLTVEDIWGGRGADLITDVDISLATTLSVHEMEDRLFSAVRKFAEMSSPLENEHLQVLMLFDAEEYDDEADYCVTVFDNRTSINYQICLTSENNMLKNGSVSKFVHKYEKSRN